MKTADVVRNIGRGGFSMIVELIGREGEGGFLWFKFSQ